VSLLLKSKKSTDVGMVELPGESGESGESEVSSIQLRADRYTNVFATDHGVARCRNMDNSNDKFRKTIPSSSCGLGTNAPPFPANCPYACGLYCRPAPPSSPRVLIGLMLGLRRQCGPTAFEMPVYSAGLYLLTGAAGEVLRLRIEVAGEIPRRAFGGGDASWNAYGDAILLY